MKETLKTGIIAIVLVANVAIFLWVGLSLIRI